MPYQGVDLHEMSKKPPPVQKITDSNSCHREQPTRRPAGGQPHRPALRFGLRQRLECQVATARIGSEPARHLHTRLMQSSQGRRYCHDAFFKAIARSLHWPRRADRRVLSPTDWQGCQAPRTAMPLYMGRSRSLVLDALRDSDRAGDSFSAGSARRDFLTSSTLVVARASRWHSGNCENERGKNFSSARDSRAELRAALEDRRPRPAQTLGLYPPSEISGTGRRLPDRPVSLSHHYSRHRKNLNGMSEGTTMYQEWKKKKKGLYSFATDGGTAGNQTMRSIDISPARSPPAPSSSSG